MRLAPPTRKRLEKTGRILRKTKSKEARGETAEARNGGGGSKAELYEEARRLDIPGRSYMTKAELKRAVRR